MATNMEKLSSVEGMPSHVTDSGGGLGYPDSGRQQQKKRCIDFKYAIPLVVVLLTLKFQGKAQNPFDTHPLLMTISIFAMLVSFLASSMKLSRPSDNTKLILSYTRDLSGALALAMLGSLLFSHSLFWSAYLVCLSPLSTLLFHLFKCFQRWLLPQTTTLQSIFSKFTHLITKLTRNDPQFPTPPIHV